MTRSWGWLSLSCLSLALPAFALFFGAADLSPGSVVECIKLNCRNEIDALIFWEIRAPRVAIGFVVGAGLAVAGATLQNVTRNSLTDPYLFGVVAGAGLGASIATVFLDSQLAKHWGLSSSALSDAFNLTLPFAAFLGALFAVALVQVLLISALGRNTELLLLAGIAVSFMLSAFSHLLLFLAEPFAANKVIFWLMGSLARAETQYLLILLPTVVLSVALLLLFGPRIDALLLGDQQARSLGVNVLRLRMLCLGICAAITAIVVAYCGGIGFVGLMIPHIARRWFGVTSRKLIAACVLLGGSFLVATDILARIAIEGQELPIGIITSAIGSLFFLLAIREAKST